VTETPGEIAAIRMSREKYLGTGDLDALDESVRLGRSAITRLAGSGALEGAAALELAASLGVLYEADGQLQRVEEALGLLDRAVERCRPLMRIWLRCIRTSRGHGCGDSPSWATGTTWNPQSPRQARSRGQRAG